MNVHFETISTSRGKQNVWKQVLVAVSKKERKEVIKIKNGKEFHRIKPREGLPGYDQEP